ncbi:hypothetical protein E6W36_08645 [Hankyongella ginsenosidimutans]|uniref:Uncharacterized protein n=1 Tax=Hankyongella ginsenosidimutans TaxID=1763828 RepID=A0A4D7C9H8_9SPHN|nr:hypothetical protein [Hankyongella ginsenosidimutans]QCI79583.1 hypothetical protein E6W36_08645 [Hankyongella ginsenosidimutans]
MTPPVSLSSPAVCPGLERRNRLASSVPKSNSLRRYAASMAISRPVGARLARRSSKRAMPSMAS